jgi:hypothetical protein
MAGRWRREKHTWTGMKWLGALVCGMAVGAGAVWNGVAFPYSRDGCQSPGLRAAGLEPVLRLPPLIHPVFGTTPTMRVSFGSKEVECMGVVRSAEAQEAPVVLVDGLDNGNYSLLMVDIDAPSPLTPSTYPYMHWLVVDTFLEDNVLDISSGRTLIPYEPPHPTDGSMHRYFIILILRRADFFEEDRLYPGSPIIPKSRANFPLDQWLGNNGLIMRTEAGFAFLTPSAP